RVVDFFVCLKKYRGVLFIPFFLLRFHLLNQIASGRSTNDGCHWLKNLVSSDMVTMKMTVHYKTDRTFHESLCHIHQLCSSAWIGEWVKYKRFITEINNAGIAKCFSK